MHEKQGIWTVFSVMRTCFWWHMVDGTWYYQLHNWILLLVINNVAGCWDKHSIIKYFILYSSLFQWYSLASSITQFHKYYANFFSPPETLDYAGKKYRCWRSALQCDWQLIKAMFLLSRRMHSRAAYVGSIGIRIICDASAIQTESRACTQTTFK